MKPDHQPKVAQWLLNHFGCSSNNDAVIGDLDEQYRSGHSRGWYLRQAVLAIGVSFFKEISNHKFRAVIAITIGWTTLIFYYLLLRPPVFSWWADSLVPLFSAKGLVVAVNLMRLLIVFAGGEISGRAVRYSSRAHWKPMVLAYAASVLMASGWIVVEVLLTDERRYVSLLPPILATTAGWVISILHGGNVFGRSSQPTYAG